MNFEGLIPVLQCHKIDETLDFYQSALRYIIIKKTVTDKGLQWAYLKSDNTFLMLQKDDRDSTSTPSSGNIFLHYYTSDITAQHQFMTAKGIKVGQIQNTPYDMSEFFIQDPEGNKIAIGQDTSHKG